MAILAAQVNIAKPCCPWLPPYLVMKPRLAALLVISLCFFTAAGIWEWKYYAADRRQGRGWIISRPRDRLLGTASLRSADLAAKKPVPLRLVTSLQNSIEVEAKQFPESKPDFGHGAAQLPHHNRSDQVLPVRAEHHPLSGTLTPSAMQDPAIVLFCYNR